MNSRNAPILPLSIPNSLKITNCNNFLFLKIGKVGAFALIPYAHLNLLNFIRVIIKKNLPILSNMKNGLGFWALASWLVGNEEGSLGL